jgi:hypothetical protein
MNTYETIIIGVISGIFTSAFIFLCINIFNKILIPWYGTVIYSGIDLSGSWEEVAEYGNATDTSRLELIQKERIVLGTKAIVKTYKDNRETETKMLSIEGQFIDGHLLLITKSTNRKIQSLSTYLLKIGKGGSVLIGKICWVDAGNGDIGSNSTELKRVNV